MTIMVAASPRNGACVSASGGARSLARSGVGAAFLFHDAPDSGLSRRRMQCITATATEGRP
jgi:hypothetical protein